MGNREAEDVCKRTVVAFMTRAVWLGADMTMGARGNVVTRAIFLPGATRVSCHRRLTCQHGAERQAGRKGVRVLYE